MNTTWIGGGGETQYYTGRIDRGRQERDGAAGPPTKVGDKKKGVRNTFPPPSFVRFVFVCTESMKCKGMGEKF